MKKPYLFKEQVTAYFIYNMLFFFLQLFYVFSHDKSFAHALSLPIAVYFELLTALLLQIGFYIILTLIQTGLLWGVTISSNAHWLNRWQIIIYSLSITTILSVNYYLFPLSEFSQLLPANCYQFIIIIMMLSLLALMILALFTLGRVIKHQPLFLALVVVVVMMSVIYFTTVSKNIILMPNTEPNIIIIGIDSLSPSSINPQLTPTIDQFLKQSVLFKETISPLARTYPAWVTILTGLYPLHSRARENLYATSVVNHNASFAWILQHHGYQTVFASDDRRFNNLDESFGFQTIIGPRLGINDILLGSFYDFPLSNLMINLPISHWLLPYNYMNRAGYFSYYPATFDHALHDFFKHKLTGKPLFFAVHFTLPHWPYAWATSLPNDVTDEFGLAHREHLYQAAIRQSDQQVSKLLQVVKQHGLLDNSLVIVLSDHGEVLYKKGARKTTREGYQGHLSLSHFEDYLIRQTATQLEMSAGHGSDLLSPDQFHSILGFQLLQHGQLISIPSVINTRVALIDIAPTIAELLNLSLISPVDGISLLATLLTQKLPPTGRFFMLESGMLPNQKIDRQNIITYAKTLFTVNPVTNALEVRADQFMAINAMKLYGVLYNDWLVALYPDNGYYLPIILRLTDNQWTDEPNSVFAQASPLTLMLKKMRRFFKQDLCRYPRIGRGNVDIPR